MWALPLLILLIFKGSPFQFACLILLFSFLGLMEFYRMAIPTRRSEGLVAAFFGSLLTATPAFGDRCGTSVFLFALTSVMLGFALVFLFRHRDIREVGAQFGILATGFLYVPLLLSHAVLLRQQQYGSEWILLLMTIVMAGDSAAYYVGTTLGKHRLYPSVSPKKSVEGSIGGLAGSVIGALLARLIFFPALTMGDCLAAALLLGLLGQLGDLFESLLKRSFGVKDSGTMIPGHGGVLDRLDSILFAAPALFYYVRFVFICR